MLFTFVQSHMCEFYSINTITFSNLQYINDFECFVVRDFQLPYSPKIVLILFAYLHNTCISLLSLNYHSPKEEETPNNRQLGDNKRETEARERSTERLVEPTMVLIYFHLCAPSPIHRSQSLETTLCNINLLHCPPSMAAASSQLSTADHMVQSSIPGLARCLLVVSW